MAHLLAQAAVGHALMAAPEWARTLAAVAGASATAVVPGLTWLLAVRESGRLHGTMQAVTSAAVPRPYRHAAAVALTAPGGVLEQLATHRHWRPPQLATVRALLLALDGEHPAPCEWTLSPEPLARLVHALTGALERAHGPLLAPAPAHLSSLVEILQGVGAVSDWIAADSSLFPPIDVMLFERDYLRDPTGAALDSLYVGLRANARARLAELGLLRSFRGEGLPARARAALRIRAPDAWRPVQQEAIALWRHAPDARFFLVQDVPGAGKARAAQLLAARLVAAGEHGVAWLTATTSAAHERSLRLANWALGALGELPNDAQVLATQWARQPVGGGPEELQLITAMSEAWSQRPLGHLWAAVSVLPLAEILTVPGYLQPSTRAALARQVVVVDGLTPGAARDRRLHALLTFLGRCQTAVIVTTVGLPDREARLLWTAYQQGAAAPQARRAIIEPPQHTPQPAVLGGHAFAISASAVSPIPAGRWLELEVKTVAQGEEALLSVAKRGVVALVCGSQDAARAAYRRLRPVAAAQGTVVTLVHDALRACDWVRTYDQLTAIAGPDIPSVRRRGRLVIATAAIDALDLDFDVIASDVAEPATLLRRMGRVHRHDRGVRPDTGRFWLLVTPEQQSHPAVDWMARHPTLDWPQAAPALLESLPPAHTAGEDPAPATVPLVLVQGAASALRDPFTGAELPPPVRPDGSLAPAFLAAVRERTLALPVAVAQLPEWQAALSKSVLPAGAPRVLQCAVQYGCAVLPGSWRYHPELGLFDRREIRILRGSDQAGDLSVVANDDHGR